MRILKCLTSLLLLLLTACSSIDRFDVPKDDKGYPSVKTIVDEVNCELARLTDPSIDPDLAYEIMQDGLVASIELDLTVNDDGSLAPNVSYLSSNNMFTFNAGAKLDVQREQSFSELLFFDLTSYDRKRKIDARFRSILNDSINSLACPTVQDTPLAGDLGIMETVQMAYHSSASLNRDVKLGGPKAGANAFSGSVKFVILKNLNMVGPTWTLKHFKGPGALAGVTETNTDQITFGFARRSATGSFPDARTASEAALNAQRTNQVVTTLTLIQTNMR